MSTVKDLKTLLIDTLVKQVEGGVTVLDKEGEPQTISAPAPVLAVAAKVIKDWADEAKEDKRQTEQLDKLSTFLNSRRPDIPGTAPKAN